MAIITLTAEEAMGLRNGNEKVLVFIQKKSVTGFEIFKFKECQKWLITGSKIEYLSGDYVEQIWIEANPHKNMITILLPSST